MPHIHTEPGQHDHTVTAYIVRIDTDQPRALVHMHKKLGKLMPIGGHVELDETPWRSMAHELREEAGYDMVDLRILQPVNRIKALARVILHPYPVAMNTHNFFDDRVGEHYHSDTAYAFVANGAPGHKVGDGESTDLRWLGQKELANLREDQIFINNREVSDFIFQTVLSTWEAVDTAEFER